MSKQLSLSANASALALVLLALTSAVGELRDARSAANDQVSPLSVSMVAN